jgi:hypothetical protein
MHEGLANYYSKQAQELREKAKNWEFMAESYEKHTDLHAKTEPKQHAAHCRAIAQNFLKQQMRQMPWPVNIARCARIYVSKWNVWSGEQVGHC